MLAFRDFDDAIQDDMPGSDDPNYNSWHHKDKKVQVCIGLTLSDSMLENVRECKSTKEMWKKTSNVLKERTLLKKLGAR